MRREYFIGVLLLLSIFAIGLVSAATTDILNFSSPITRGNYSGTFNFSARTSAQVTDLDNNFNVTLYCNSSGGSVAARTGVDLIRVITISNTSSTQVVFENATVNIASFEDGWIYNCSAYSDNYTDQTWANTGVITASNVTIDNTPPNVSLTFVSPIAYSNYSNTTRLIQINITVNDLTVGLDRGSVWFNITYSNGTQVNFSRAILLSGYYNLSLDTTELAGFIESRYNITVYANDSLNNVNSSIHTQISMDRTAPTGSLTCSPLTVNRGDTITCTCSGSDATSGISSGIGSYNPSTSQTGAFTESCTITDHAGNSLSLSQAYTVSLQSSGSSGGGGGGGGTTVAQIPSNQTVTATSGVSATTARSFAQILPSTQVVMSSFGSGTGISEIKIEVSQEANNVRVVVDKYESKPASVSVEKSNTYKYLHIEAQNLTDKLSKAIINIQVEKSWASSNELNKEDIALFKYDENSDQWNPLPTTFDKEDSTYYYYNAELNSFSYFAIASNKISTEEQQAGMILGMPYWVWIIIAVVVLLAILIGKGFSQKRKGKKNIVISHSSIRKK